MTFAAEVITAAPANAAAGKISTHRQSYMLYTRFYPFHDISYGVKLRLARWVLGSGVTVTTSDGSSIPYLSRSFRPTRPCHPSVGRCNKYRKWFRSSLARSGAFEVTTLWRFI